MAYTPTLENSMPIPVEPVCLGPIRVTRTTANVDYPVKIPWKNCRLVYAYAMTTTVVATADLEIDLELDAAGGTEMMSITLPTSSSAIGDVAEATVTTAAACKNLGRQDTARDVVNIECNLHASGAGVADVYMWFEAERSQ